MTQQSREFIAASEPMKRALEQLTRVSRLDTTVLVQGPSGTGKEVAARFLHENHPTRRRGPLVCIHCGAIPETLLESELFGHVKGAYTGADRDRSGKFEQADGGTLFLDEISTMTPAAQTRLLRVLQERRITRVGSTESRDVDVRVIVATNQDLEGLIAQGTFRLDLYYRISTYPVSLPALRERPADIAPLAQHFARVVAARLGLTRTKSLSADVLKALAAYDWPGNVRELENAVEYASIQSEPSEFVERHHLPAQISGLDTADSPVPAGLVLTEDGLSLRSAVTRLERELILQSLRLADGNKARAAALLELKRTTFLEKMRRLDLEGAV